MALADYRKKRKFSSTPEPRGRRGARDNPIFVVQRHAARRLHYDFRLQIDGVLKSWAVPKGPPLSKGEKRLAIHVEDHPLEYATFEGQIPKGNYGAGDVQIWDEGTFQTEGELDASAQLEKGDLKIRLEGKRLRGSFVLVKMRNSARGNEWLLIRKTDSESAPAAAPEPDPKAARSPRKREILDPGTLEGASAAPMPERVSVALATLAEKPFSDPAWLFEIKWDGERALAWIRDGSVELRARSGRDITREFPELKELARRLGARQAIVDGEIVVLDEEGRSEFKRIQPRFGVLNPPASLLEKSPATYYAFDLLYCDGYDLRKVALTERKRLLRHILQTSEAIRFSDHQAEKGVELFELAKSKGLEGIVAKQQNSPYVEKRSRLWLKFKVVHDLDVVIGGWTAPRKTRDYFGSLLMGLYRGDGLLYIGSVGTGFAQETLKQTYDTLRNLSVSACPFKTIPKVKEKTHWVKPQLVARVKFGEWTEDKKLRQPVFLGFREDKTARECEFEGQVARKPSGHAPPRVSKPQPRAAGGDSGIENELLQGTGDSLSVELDGKPLALTNLNKVYFQESGLRKRDLLLYYFRIAPYLLPFLKDRPLVLKRYPNGIDKDFFFQKEAPSSRPDWLRTVPIYSPERKAKMQYVVADDRADLLYLTNLGCIDHNPWSSRFDDQDHPDYVFFDLDPTSGTPFSVVLTVARAIFEQLKSLQVHAYLKTSGASGFHIYVPVEAKYTYEEVRMFAQAIGERTRQELPRLITFERKVSARRSGTVLIDAVQNARGKPLAAAYSVRPFPGAPVSAPVSPAELAKPLRPEDLNVRTVFRRLERSGDLWGDFWKHRQRLEDMVVRAK